MERDGRVRIASGTNPQGQGHATTFAQIAAQALGVSVTFESVTVTQGDTASSPAGVGALASRSTAIGGSAVQRAAEELRERLRRGEPLPLEASVSYAAKGEAWSSGCCVAAVSIDRDTGELSIERFAWADDAGLVVNPLLAEGQLVGGYAQGLGQALMERLVYDGEGQLLTGSLMDYAVPRARDIPPLSLGGMQTASLANVLGAKGVGESGAIGVPAAVLNAAMDALSVHGVKHLDLPLTSEKLWRAIQMEIGA
jgi:carbon-monoxide dehydrogenase large subunit